MNCNCQRVATIELHLPILCVHVNDAPYNKARILLQLPTMRQRSGERNPPASARRVSLPQNVNICDDCIAWMQAETDGWQSALIQPPCSKHG